MARQCNHDEIKMDIPVNTNSLSRVRKQASVAKKQFCQYLVTRVRIKEHWG